MILDKILSFDNSIEIFAILVFAIIVIYIVGAMISHIIDKKLGNIEIQMPKINISSQHPPQPPQPPQVVFKISHDANGKINLQPLNESDCPSPLKLPKENVFTHPNRIQKLEPFLNVSFEDTARDSPNKQTPNQPSRLQSNTNDVPYKRYTEEMIIDELDYPIIINTTTPPTEVKSKVGCSTDADCNSVYGDGKNVCKADGTCHCVSGSGIFCHLGPTNYKDPKDMTPEERERFKLKYRSNMTLQDYKNWLMLYKGEVENLRQHHRRNLLKLLKGGILTVRDVPSVRIKPPTDAADYFQKMYKGGKISVHFPDNDSPLVGANYNQYTDFIPPENAGSSWITGVVDLYKEGGKDDAKALDWNLRPEITTGTEEESVGQIYQQYVRKQHDLADLRKIARIIDENEKAQIPQRKATSLQTFTSEDLNVTDV